MRWSSLLSLGIALLAAPAGAQPADYHRPDSVALAVPAHAATSVDSIAHYLGRGLATPEEKARAIYRWVTENIDYDVRAFYGNRMAIPLQTPENVLRRRRAICDGYSGLVWALGQRMGLEMSVVEGWAKGGGRDPRDAPRRGRHSWNAVRIDGEWRLIDATWGAGDLIGRDFVRRVRDFFFFADPEKLSFSHLPRDPLWQLLEAPLSTAQFDRQVMPSRDFWELGWDADAVRSAGAELVGAFPIRDRTVRVHRAPVSGRLNAGETVELSLEAPGATEVIAISGAHWQPLEADDGVFAGQAAMEADRLVVMVRYPDLPEGTIVLEYRAR